MLDTIYKQVVAALITVIFSIITSNFDRLIKFYKKRVNWFRPEFDLKAGDSFDIVTSSLTQKDDELTEIASDSYLKEDKTVIGDIEPVLVVLRGRNLKVQHYLSDGLPKLRRDEYIISFGGEVSNEFTSLVLKRRNSPLRFRGYKIFDSGDRVKYAPKWDKNGRIILDYALIVRTPNPLRTKELNRIVYIFAGIHKPGTLGAAYFTQDRYASMINEAVAGMKSFVVLAEIQVDYLGAKSLDPIITPKSIVRVYDLPYKYSSVNY